MAGIETFSLEMLLLGAHMSGKSLGFTSTPTPFNFCASMLEHLCALPNPTDIVETAYMLFTDLERRMTYGTTKRRPDIGYRNAAETFEDREGICGELTYAYMTMARFKGICTSYVHVDIDASGKNVEHACALVMTKKPFLVDPAYHAFGIDHRRYRVLSDEEATASYLRWRNNGSMP